MSNLNKWDKTFIYQLKDWEQLSSCKKHKVGVIITRENRPITSGYNGTLPNEDNNCEESENVTKLSTIHAEVNAIGHAAKKGVPLQGTTMYCSLLPCPTCAALIIQSGIKKLFYISESSSGIDGNSKEILNKIEVIKCS